MVGVGASKAALLRDRCGDDGKTARYQIAAGAGRAHCPDKGGRAAGELHFGQRLVDKAGRLAGKQGKPRIECLLEIQFAAHGACRDRQYVIRDAGKPRHVVERFRGDDGAVHIGD